VTFGKLIPVTVFLPTLVLSVPIKVRSKPLALTTDVPALVLVTDPVNRALVDPKLSVDVSPPFNAT